MKDGSYPTRPYRQSARAQSAAETGARILDAFIARLPGSWFDEIRLEDVAHDAGVTVQTVIRRFGGKDGLLTAASDQMQAQILGGRDPNTGDVGTAIDALIAEYEAIGGLVMRMLAQEDRHPAIRAMTDRGRSEHRKWVGTLFAPRLALLPPERREETHDRLVIALDIYVWKLLRVDMGRSKAALHRTMLAMAAGALDLEPGALDARPVHATGGNQ